MQKSNVNACPHIGEWRHNIKTGSKTLFICPWCHDKLMERLDDKEFLRGMIKSTMTLGEIVRMRREQAEDYARRDAGIAFAVDGYPRLPMISASAGVM